MPKILDNAGAGPPKYGGFQRGIAKFGAPAGSVAFRGAPRCSAAPFVWSVVLYFAAYPSWALGSEASGAENIRAFGRDPPK